MFEATKSEIDQIIARDPAARSRLEVALCYPSFHAVMAYRLSSWLWRRNKHILARFVSTVARWISDIEIHPGARIGRGLFIDHGLGVVIGETVEIGDNVTIYQGVTLGGVSPSQDSNAQRGMKRHPTLESDVIVGSGAQILGPITVGRGARVGANAVVTKDVAPGATVVGIPARCTGTDSAVRSEAFTPYGLGLGLEMSDPYGADLRELRLEIHVLRKRLDVLASENRALRFAAQRLHPYSGIKPVVFRSGFHRLPATFGWPVRSRRNMRQPGSLA